MLTKGTGEDNKITYSMVILGVVTGSVFTDVFADLDRRWY